MVLSKYLNVSRRGCENDKEGSSDGNAVLLPAQRRIMEFMRESKEKQTFYANCEGFYTRRIVNVTDTKSLRRFIYCTLFNKEDEPDTVLEEQKAKVDEIESNMIRISRRYAIPPREIHFTVVWVYYYVYENCEEKAMPLFKIFKVRDSSDQAIFLDLEFNAYDGWEEYLDNAALPKSFLCLPRNGTYVCQPDSESPDLIYVISKSLRSAHFPVRTWKDFQPFSVSLAHAIIPKFNACSAAILKKIDEFFCFLVNVSKEKENLLRVLLYAAYVGLKVFFHCYGGTSLYENLVNAAYMLLNNREETHPPCVPKALENAPAVNGMKSTFNFFTNSKPNWDLIFHFLVQYPQTERMELLLEKYPAALCVLKVLRGIVEAVDFIRKTCKVTQAVKSGGDFPCIANTENSNLGKTQAAFQKNNRTGVRELISRLGKVEKNPEEISEAGESSRVNGSAPETAPFAIPIDDDSFPGTVYVFSSAKLPKIYREMKTIFEVFFYRPRTDREYEISDNEGRLLGTLYVVGESCAFVHVLNKNSN